MAETYNDSVSAILEKIDLLQSPDDTLVQRVNKRWFGWLRTLVSGIFDTYHPIQPTSESAVQMILAANEKHYLDQRTQGETYKEGSSGFANRERGLYIHMFAAVVCLMELRARYPFTEMDEVFTKMLDSDHVHIRTASGLALLSMGNKNVKLDLEGLERSIELGAFFSFPLNYYFQILHNLLRHEDLYKPAAKQIRIHFDKETSDFQEGSYVLFRFLETAIFLASASELSKHSLMYLVYLSEGNVRDDIELAYVKRIRGVLIELIETSPKARQVIADYMIAEGRQARGWEFIAFYKAWEKVDWQTVEEQVVKDYLELASKVDAKAWGYDSARVIVKAILPWSNRVPLVVDWFRDYVDAFLNSDLDAGSEFLSPLISGLGDLVRINEMTSSLLLLARNASSIYVRYAALRTLLHYGLESQQLKIILDAEKFKTAEHLQSLYNSPRFLIELQYAGIEIEENEVTEEDVSDYMDRKLQYRRENFDHFSIS